jgi:hypothetical protein
MSPIHPCEDKTLPLYVRSLFLCHDVADGCFDGRYSGSGGGRWYRHTMNHMMLYSRAVLQAVAVGFGHVQAASDRVAIEAVDGIDRVDDRSVHLDTHAH